MSGLQLTGITKSFQGMPVLQDIQAQVNEGEFVSFVGPSGCGKSTLLNIIAGLEGSDGDVLFGDQSIESQDLISYMPQQDLLLPWRTILQNIVLPLEINKVEKKRRMVEGMKVLEQFGLAEYANHYPEALSGGMRQRISFLRTYLCKKPIMLLDEPFGKLDAFTKMDVHRWLLQSWQKGKQTIVMVTHDLEEAVLLSDRIFILSQKPSMIIDEVRVRLPRPRTMEMITSNVLKEDKDRILRILSPFMAG
ncbi:ABC transporter ATP-binding protein [Ectobacillus polymachus]|uniref:ABC transporter ATP-binding protein n=1 Tax=Ectobacillus polymachus TaxID=1508806 RepID=UPI003A8603CA